MPCTLLVIDDNRSVRESLRFLLLRRGYEVLTADGGRAGIALAQAHPVDGVLLDFHMPEMDGVAVCRELTALAARRGRPLPVWMMTGARTTAMVQNATAAGALVVLTKPFDLPDLFRRLEEKLGPGSPPAGGSGASR